MRNRGVRDGGGRECSVLMGMRLPRQVEVVHVLDTASLRKTFCTSYPAVAPRARRNSSPWRASSTESSITPGNVANAG